MMLNRLYNFLAKKVLKRATLRDPALLQLFGESFTSLSGVKVDEGSSLKFSPVWGAVTLLGRDVAKLPIMVSKIKRSDGFRTADRAHPAYRILRQRPNSFQTPYLFKFKAMHDAMLHGNSYSWIRRHDGVPTDILPLSPVQTRIEIVDAERFLYITRVEGIAEEFPLMPEDVLHIRGLTSDGIAGIKTVDKAREAVGMGMGGQEFTNRFFSNNTNSNLVFSHPGELEGKVADRLRASIEKKQAGLENAWKPWILEDGMTAMSVSHSNQDAELPELFQMSIRDVANYFNIPASKLGDVAKVSFSSLEEDSRNYVDQAVDPWLCNWEEELTLKLFSTSERRAENRIVEFDRKRLNRANLAARGDFVSKMIQMGVMSRNEARQDLGMNAVDGGDNFLVPVNLQDPDEEPEPMAKPFAQPEPTEEGETNEENSFSPDFEEIALQAFEALVRRFEKEGDTESFRKAWDRRLSPVVSEGIAFLAYGRLLNSKGDDLSKLPARFVKDYLG